MYFVIMVSDGDTFVEAMEKHTLLRALERFDYGDPDRVATELPPGKLGDGMLLIIKGEVVKPKPKTAVETWDIK
jgi:hypothetical protein